MTNTRDTLYRRMVRRIKTEAARGGSARPKEGSNTGYDSKGRDASRGTADYSQDKTHIEAIETTGPTRQIIRRMPTKIVRRVRKLAEINNQINKYIYSAAKTVYDLRPWREKSVQELEELAEKKRREKMERTLFKEGELFSKRASKK